MTATDAAPPVAGGAVGLRPEVQLLRAVAVLAVVGNHLWSDRVPGGYVGVDVFFVISGYLITGHLLRELDRTGRVDLRRFWGRRARRLLPASLLVLGATAAATFLLVPATRWQDVLQEIWASAFYVQNWLLAGEARDYFASTESPSPVTHYWSLSLEEQFYLVWPVLALSAYAAGRWVGRPRAVLAGVLALVVVASLACSVWVTAAQPAAAYFLTPARMWQLGAGGLLAFVPTLVRGRHAAAVAGWAGILGSVAVLDEGSPVPGWITVVPVLAACLVIAGGDAFLRDVPRPLRPGLAAGLWVGGVSYAVYLWHWPPVVIVPYATGSPLDSTDRVLLLAALLPVAWATTRFVEDPVRRSRRLAVGPARRTFVPALAGMLAVAAVTQVGGGLVDGRRAAVETRIDDAIAGGDPCIGARAVANRCARPHVLRYPDSALLTVQNHQHQATWGEACLQRVDEPGLLECEFGVPRSKAALRVALVGDSHARHWFPAVDTLAVEHRWNVVFLAKPSCPVTTAAVRTRRFPEHAASCRAWRRQAAARVAEDPSIDAVLTSANSRNYVVDGLPFTKHRVSAAGRAEMVRGYRETWARWTGSGKKVVVIGDVPSMEVGDIPTCVASAPTYVDPCTSPASVATGDPLLAAARRSGPAVVAVDLRRFFCGPRRCHSVIGGVVAWGDDNHLIAHFSRSLAPYLYQEMRPALR